MDGWVRQVYVTTKEFTPLMQNALLAMEEWVRLLHTEQTAPQRQEESDFHFEWRQDAAPMELAVSFIADYLTRCYLEVRRIRNMRKAAPQCPPTCRRPSTRTSSSGLSRMSTSART